MKILSEIVSYLTDYNFELSSINNDGRVNSILNEDEVLKIISKKFDIVIPSSRNWADFYVNDIPVNIKITTTTTNDNASSKKGIYFALTGQVYVGSESWESYLKRLSQDIRPLRKSFFYVKINSWNEKKYKN